MATKQKAKQPKPKPQGKETSSKSRSKNKRQAKPVPKQAAKKKVAATGKASREKKSGTVKASPKIVVKAGSKVSRQRQRQNRSRRKSQPLRGRHRHPLHKTRSLEAPSAAPSRSIPTPSAASPTDGGVRYLTSFRTSSSFIAPSASSSEAIRRIPASSIRRSDFSTACSGLKS